MYMPLGTLDLPKPPAMASSSNPDLPFLFSLSSLIFLLLAGGTAATMEAAPTSPTSPSNGTTIYELLPEYGLPSGLLPDTVKSFQLGNDGIFVVELEGPCYVQFEYLVYYEPRITGVVKYGSIDELRGIQVRRFFLWFDVDAIKVDLPPSDFIYFEVGWITKQLPVGQFETVHSCQDNGLAGRVRRAADSLLQGKSDVDHMHQQVACEKLPDLVRKPSMLVAK